MPDWFGEMHYWSIYNPHAEPCIATGIVSLLAPVSSNRERCNLHAIIAEIGRVFRATLPLLRVFANGRKARGMVGREVGRDD